MNKPSLNLLANYRASQDHSLAFGTVVIVLMMVSIGIGFVQLGARLMPNWHGGYLAGVSLVIAVEAIATRKYARDLDLREKALFYLSEWIAFAVALKLLLYLVHGPAQIFQDIPLWQTDFWLYFFTSEYLLVLFMTGLIWLSSRGYLNDLETLYDREQDATWDDLGKLQNSMQDFRRRVASRVFFLGGLVVILAILARMKVNVVLNPVEDQGIGYAAPIINVLFYFILALGLLSQTQFALLRVRWMWQRLPISPNLARNWVKYGIIFFVALAVVVFFLPTHYSMGLLDTLRYAMGFLFQFFTILIALIALPISFCMSLFSVTNPQGGVSPIQPASPPPPVPGGQPIAWLEFLRSLAFWIIFLAVIFFALRYYLSQNTALWKAIQSFPLFGWLSKSFSGLWKWLKGANRQVSQLVQSGIQRLRQQRGLPVAQSVRRIFNFSRMSPRQKIIYFYIRLVELGDEQGLHRKPSQTPYQYKQQLGSTLPEINEELNGLTETFLEARYSRHPVEPPTAEQAGSLWERIRAVLKSWKREEK